MKFLTYKTVNIWMSIHFNNNCAFKKHHPLPESLSYIQISSVHSRLTARIATSTFLILAWNYENCRKILDSYLTKSCNILKSWFLSRPLKLYLTLEGKYCRMLLQAEHNFANHVNNSETIQLIKANIIETNNDLMCGV